MTEGTATQGPPTYFANIVTLQVTADEVILELRRYLQPHKDILLNPTQQVDEHVIIPAPTPAQLFAEEPIARVVLTYTAAESLRRNLSSMLPNVERARKTGENPWQQLRP